MTEIRVPAVSAGTAIGDEPQGWSVFDAKTARFIRFEPNPNYVKPPPPTPLDEARWEVERLEQELADARAELAELEAAA